jgi:hypothetical protein
MVIGTAYSTHTLAEDSLRILVSSKIGKLARKLNLNLAHQSSMTVNLKKIPRFGAEKVKFVRKSLMTKQS